jgi:2-hydroxycyclohexanecarboxyl-CoA dehydrogenase
MTDDTDTVAIVTGAGRGIGRAIAQELMDAFSVIAVNDIEAARAESTAVEIRDQGRSAVPIQADVTDYAAVESFVGNLETDYGTVHALVNNAGVARTELFIDQKPGDWDDLIEVNLRGQLNCAHVVGKRMVEEDTPGSIVNVASDAGRVGATGQAVYAGAKGGVIAFTKTLARELAPYGITCNAVAPGQVDTPLLTELRSEDTLGAKLLDGIEENIPLDRIGAPVDVASAVAFLVGEDSSYITGQVLSVNGGVSMPD